MLKKVEKGDVIICSELSRLGRNLFMIMEILNICMTKECKVWTIKDNYRLGDDIQSKVLAFAFGLSAEIERNLISQRTKEAGAEEIRGSAVRTPKRKDFSTRNLQTSPQRKIDTRPARRGCFICQDRQYTESEQGHRAALLPYFFRREKMKKCLLYCVFQNNLLSLQRILSTN